ncbi:MAG: polysaccharide deacetylase family protein [Anaerolineaceae bacterium]|jgi:peptidoglycan/xylan/chitin deacetylase (PgdA/CDA1 family)|nr:polysaccharide deacetylase family protein [Anaerolineaceae bacterium]
MKKNIFPFVMILVLSMAACSPKAAPVDVNAIYTEAAMTVAVQFTEAAAKIPTATPAPPTATAEPTATEAPPTATIEPTPVPTEAWSFHPAGPVVAPVLLYNSVADSVADDPNYQWESNFNIATTDFYMQMLTLKEAGYTAVPVSLLVKAIREGADLPAKPVAITFDIGRQTVYTKAFPIMEEMGFIGNAFIPSNYLNGNGMLTIEQAKELAAAGWEIGSNGMNHTDLTTYLNLGDEISNSRLALQEKLGVEVTTFAYVGNPDAQIVSRVAEWGYAGAVGLLQTTEHPAPFLIGRFEMTNDRSLEDFANILPWKPASLPAQPAQSVLPTETPAQ